MAVLVHVNLSTELMETVTSRIVQAALDAEAPDVR